jgi:hypothetical protein
MLFKGFSRNLGGPVPSSGKRVLGTEGTRFEDEVQVVGSTHSTDEEGVNRQVYRRGETMRDIHFVRISSGNR